MKTQLAVVLVSLATSAIVNATPLPQPNYDPTLQIPQSVFDFQTPNILTRSEGLWNDGNEFLLVENEPNPAAPTPDQKQSGEPIDVPGYNDNQQRVVPKKDSGINAPPLSNPDFPDIQQSQQPEFRPIKGGESGEGLDALFNLIKPSGWW